ncbi:hypothetical protein GGI07_000846 [Coemansia sp. Benny D115]|nr:hypothetical protein GGI07_000846 [Coemansia sp. Benny D115]
MQVMPRAEDATTSTLDKILAGIFTDDAQSNQASLSIYALANDPRRPPKISKGLFAWIPVLWRTSEEYLLDNVDVDSVFFLRFLRMCMWLMGIYTILGMCIIVPLNFSNGNNAYVTSDLQGFWLLWITLYHITKLSVLTLHNVAAYLFTAIFFYFLWREYKRYIVVKQKYFLSPQYLRKLQSRTIMVTRVPAEMQSDRALHAFISSKTSGVATPTQVSIARKIGELQELVAKHERAVRKLEKVLAKYLAGDYQQKPRPKIKVAGAMVDAIEHYTLEIESLEITINQARRETETFKPTSVGFLSYSSPQMAHNALRTISGVAPALVTGAPHPKDIIWSNAQMPKATRTRRLWISRLISIIFCFVAFWPVAALTFIGNVVNIQAIWKETIPFFTKHDMLTTLWQTTFSPLILTLYYIAIPHVFRAISRYQGITTNTGVERSVLKRMYMFYFLSNFVVLTLVSIVVRAVLKKYSFKETMSMFAHNFIESLNNKAQFWTAYVSLKGMNAMLEFAQLISLAMIFFKRYTRDLTPRELRDLTKPPDFDYSPVYSLYLWVFTISIFYSLYSPILLPFAFLDFALAYWVYKYAIMYVYQTKFDTGGAMWRNVMNRMITSVIIFQVYMICCLKARMDEFVDRPDEVKTMQPIVYSLIPLPVITAALGIYMNRWMGPKVDYMQQSAEADHLVDSRKVADEDANAEDSLGDRFLHPTFSQPLLTPLVDKRIRHLLPKVYRGRISMHGGTIKQKPYLAGSNNDSGFAFGEGKFGPGTANTSTLFGSEGAGVGSTMDERDRRDFDGTSTPLPFEYHGTGQMNAKGLARSYSVDSNVSGGDSVEMMRLGGGGKRYGNDSTSSSQADLLGHAHYMSPSEVSEHGMDEMLLMKSLSSSSINKHPHGTDVDAMGDKADAAHNRAMYPTNDFDAVDLYSDRRNGQRNVYEGGQAHDGYGSDLYVSPYVTNTSNSSLNSLSGPVGPRPPNPYQQQQGYRPQPQSQPQIRHAAGIPGQMNAPASQIQANPSRYAQPSTLGSRPPPPASHSFSSFGNGAAPPQNGMLYQPQQRPPPPQQQQYQQQQQQRPPRRNVPRWD